MWLHKLQITKMLSPFSRTKGRAAHKRGFGESHPLPGMSFRAVTYNIHKCRGMDRRVLPRRIVEVLREVDADIVALQEVLHADSGGRGESHARYIADELGFHYSFGENRRIEEAGYGNLILSRFPLIHERNYDLSREGRERRGCLRVDISLPHGGIVHVYNAHLGTDYRERCHQGRELVRSDILGGSNLKGPRILLGDFNEWLPGLASRLLSEHFRSPDIRRHLGRKRTYPGLLPFLHLDHMYFDDTLAIERARLHRSRKAVLASDHLPIVADFTFTEAV